MKKLSLIIGMTLVLMFGSCGTEVKTEVSGADSTAVDSVVSKVDTCKVDSCKVTTLTVTSVTTK